MATIKEVEEKVDGLLQKDLPNVKLELQDLRTRVESLEERQEEDDDARKQKKAFWRSWLLRISVGVALIVLGMIVPKVVGFAVKLWEYFIVVN